MARPKKYELPHGEGSFFQRADGIWVGRIEAGFSSRGTRRRIQVTSKDKETAWTKLLAKRKEIMLNGLTPEGIRAGATVESWISDWINRRQHDVRPKTYHTDASIVRKWIIPTIGRQKLETLSPAHIRKLTETMRAASLSTTTARYAQRILQQALKDAIVEGHQVPQRVLAVEKPRAAVSDRTSIPLEDAIKLLNVARNRGEGARWVAALLQGMRQGEVLGLTWDRVDLDAGTLDISWQLQKLHYEDRARGTFMMPDGYEAIQVDGALHLVRPKTKSGYRLIPLVPWMRAELARLASRPHSPNGFVFTRSGDTTRPRTQKEDSEAWKALQAQAGVHKGEKGYYVLHEARHTTATLLLAADVDPEIIKAIMGHSDIVTTAGYQHVSQAMARRALEKVATTLQLDA